MFQAIYLERISIASKTVESVGYFLLVLRMRSTDATYT